MDECIFCKIISKELPSVEVAQSANFYAFLDIEPVSEGHTLIVPKQHCTNLLDLPESLGNELVELSQLIGQAVIVGLGAEGFNFYQNNGSSAGQVVFHTHFHIIPRNSGDGKSMWPKIGMQKPDDLKKVQEKMHQAMG